MCVCCVGLIRTYVYYVLIYVVINQLCVGSPSDSFLIALIGLY